MEEEEEIEVEVAVGVEDAFQNLQLLPLGTPVLVASQLLFYLLCSSSCIRHEAVLRLVLA